MSIFIYFIKIIRGGGDFTQKKKKKTMPLNKKLSCMPLNTSGIRSLEKER